jgi:hypothetical protein
LRRSLIIYQICSAPIHWGRLNPSAPIAGEGKINPSPFDGGLFLPSSLAGEGVGEGEIENL